MTPSRFRCLALCFAFLPLCAWRPIASDSFWGSTPCDVYIKSVLGIPAEAPCTFLKWQLALKREGDAGTFTLEVIYGADQPGTNGFKNGGTTLKIEGTYKVVATEDKRMRYELSAASLRNRLMLLALNDDLFHILDSQQKLLVGNGGYSYMLNGKR